MMLKHSARSVRMIPLDRIEVLNHRDRNKMVFDEIVGNIKSIGLKKPVTVTARASDDGSERFLLVCGEGRLNAFRTLGEATIPALVIDVSDEDALIMSLAENIARRQCRPLEILAGIRQLKDKGYSPKDISTKTGLTAAYVVGILTLLQHGEERLLVAVETGRVPLNAALSIVGAGDDDKAVQTALQEAYESGKLRGKKLMEVRRVIERRQTLGRTVARGTKRGMAEISTSSIVRTYQREVDRQMLMVKKSELTQQRLLFVVSALRQLFADENFVNLLRAEKLETLPKYLSDRIWANGSVP
jgi:ParB family chromosome partitioning protein